MTRNPLPLLAALAATAAGCDESSTTDVELRIWMDAAAELPIRNPTPEGGDLDAILVAFDTISVHHTEAGWLESSSASGFIDLTDPRMLPVMLSSWRSLPEGSYDQIRFHVHGATVVFGDTWHPLEIPSGDASGLKVHTSFCLAAGGDVESLELAWDVEGGLHHSETRGYWLTPSIQVWSAPTCADDETTPPPEPPSDR